MKKNASLSGLLCLALAFFVSCARVSVKQTGRDKFSLKCQYSRSKCEAKVAQICSDENKVSNVLIRKEAFENDWMLLPFGYLSAERPVIYLLVECAERNGIAAAKAKMQTKIDENDPTRQMPPDSSMRYENVE